MKKHLLLMFLAVLCCIGIATAAEQNYDIVFKSVEADKAEGSTAITVKSVSDVITEGTEFVSKAEASNIFLGKNGYGLKFSTSSKNGTLILTLAEKVTPTKIVVNAQSWISSGKDQKVDAGAIAINGKTAKNTTSTFAYYEFTDFSEISQIKIEATKRIYLKSITVYYEDGASNLKDPEIAWVNGDEEVITKTKMVKAEETYEYNVISTFDKDPDFLINHEAMTFTSSDPEIVSVEKNTEGDNACVYLRANKRGTATITAHYAANGQYSEATATLEVEVFDESKQEDGNYYVSLIYPEMNFDKLPIEYTYASKQLKTYLKQFEVKTTATMVNNVYPVIEAGGLQLKDGQTMTFTAPKGKVLKGYTVYKADGDGVATVDGEELVYGKEVTLDDIKAFTVKVPEGTALIDRVDLILADMGTPSKPVFSHEPGFVKWQANIRITCNNADYIHYEIEYLDNKEPATLVGDNDAYYHNLASAVRDMRVTAYGVNAADNIQGEPVVGEFIIRGPQLTTEAVSGEYPIGSRIYFNSDYNNSQTYTILVTPKNGETYEYQHMWIWVSNDEIWYTVSEDAHIEVYATAETSSNKGPEGNHLELDITATPMPVPVPYVNGEVVTGPIPDGTEVTFKADCGTFITWSEYSITGDLKYETFDFVAGSEANLVVDKMHRRYYVQNFNGDLPSDKQYSAPCDMVFELDGTNGKSYWKQIQSLDELSDGTRIVIGNDETQSGVMSTDGANSKNTTWKYADYTFDKSDKDAWRINDLPENARIITLEKTETANQYLLKVDGGYFTAKNNDTELKVAATGNDFVFAMIDGGKAKIALPNDSKRAIRTNGDKFGYYADTYKPVIVFKEVVEAAEPIEYAMTLHHTTFTVGNNEETTMARAKSSTDHDLHQDFVKNAEGMHEATIENDLCGDFVLDIEGEEIGGHITSAKTDFHTDVEGVEDCAEGEHAPYVYVGENADNIRLTHVANNANAVMLSTNPNEYHTQLEKHNAGKSTLQVKLDPFVSATLAVSDQEGGVTGVENIVVDAIDADAIYYDLSGRRVYGKPVPGVYIEVRGTEATKVYLR